MLSQSALIKLLLIGIVLPHLCQCTARDMIKSAQDVPEQCDASNCRVPLCKCSNTEIPNDIPFDDTPMMVGLSFNGVVTSNHAKYLKRILNPVFKNPNDCPIQSTFFLSHVGNGTTDYCFVQGLFNNNNEIGVGSRKYKCPYTDCDSEGQFFGRWRSDDAEEDIYQQKKLIEFEARINRSFLRGFRIPLLDQRGNAHFKALKKYAFSYDSSVIVRPEDIKRNNGLRFWPHTLDFPANYSCATCPTKKSLCNSEESKECPMHSVWIVPLHYLNVEGSNPCPMLIKDEIAENRLETKNCVPLKELNKTNILEQLTDNFNRHYKTNKAPFIVNIELSWFERYGDMLTDALVEFIDNHTKSKESKAKEDVYFVTIAKIIEWIQYPTPLHVISNKWLWDCDNTNFDYDEECETLRKLKENSLEMDEIKKRNRTLAQELHGEDLFRSGILTAVVVIFIVAITFTIIYDKYK